MTTFNLALLGGGIFATTSYLPALSQPSNKHINLHTLWSRSESTVQTLHTKAKELGHSPQVLFGPEALQKIWDDKSIDAVSFVLPITAQPELILTALKAGKHVISEKPVGKDVQAARELIEEYEKVYKPQGLIWRVAENFEHETIINLARDALRNDKSLGPVLYWRFHAEGHIPDGSAYQATSWRTIPDYQGGFLLDGGVHYAAMIRRILPPSILPAEVIASASLHRAHLPPHDTIMGLALPSSKTASQAHGAETASKAINDPKSIPGGLGESLPTGQILISNSLPDTNPSTRAPLGITITTVNAVIEVVSGKRRQWTFKVIPGEGTDVKAQEETGPADGVENELNLFAKVVQAKKDGEEVDEEDEGRGYPTGPLWDVSFIQGLLKSNGRAVELATL